jgi:hypothetical protein
MASRLFEAPLFRQILSQPGTGEYTDFNMVAVERVFPAPAIESDSASGWAWWELKFSAAPRADLDALRLLAMFLAHWDNKADNQRLICLDAGEGDGATGGCREPLLMIQDLGATFGPYKANLGGWRNAPFWTDAAGCRISMTAFPFAGASFPDARISEEGRLQLLAQLQALTDADVRGLFREARFPEYQGTTDDGLDLDQWASAFNRRVRMLAAGGPCPAA